MVSGHPNMGGPMQRMTPPRGMVPLGPQVTEHVSVKCICGYNAAILWFI